MSELLSQQHLPCVSHLSWTTNQQRAWVKEAELSLPGSRALPRVNLLLIGCLRAGQGGEWRLTDSSGSVRCEVSLKVETLGSQTPGAVLNTCLSHLSLQVLSPSPSWLNQPVFLPHWNYIPHNAPGQEEPAGWVEVIGSPVLLSPGPELGLADSGGVGGLSGVLGVREAAGVLQHR